MLAVGADAAAVIIRDPLAIFQSMYNRGRPRLDHLDESLRAIDALAQCVPVISFSRMVSDPYYLHTIAKQLGIDDLPENAPGRARRNESRRQFPMPATLRRRAETRLAWFAREYRDLF